MSSGDDRVRQQRTTVARWVERAQRVGYLAWAVSTALVIVGLLTTFSSAIATAVVVCLVGGSIVLAPAIILGYAVRAAERDDRERGL